ncbi:UNVERIFIED_CONTAM: hypothetical protein RMT77_019956 [Armadillidium vulgare]
MRKVCTTCRYYFSSDREFNYHRGTYFHDFNNRRVQRKKRIFNLHEYRDMVLNKPATHFIKEKQRRGQRFENDETLMTHLPYLNEVEHENFLTRGKRLPQENSRNSASSSTSASTSEVPVEVDDDGQDDMQLEGSASEGQDRSK